MAKSAIPMWYDGGGDDDEEEEHDANTPAFSRIETDRLL